MLEKLSHHLANEEGDFEKTGFIQVRLVGPRAKKQTKKPVRPKDGGKRTYAMPIAHRRSKWDFDNAEPKNGRSG